MVNKVIYVYIVKPHNGVLIGSKCYFYSVEHFCGYIDCCLGFSVHFDFSRSGKSICVDMKRLPDIRCIVVDHNITDVQLTVTCLKLNYFLTCTCERHRSSVGNLRKKHHSFKADLSGYRNKASFSR